MPSPKKKTDKIDAHILADLDRGNYLIECHVPSQKAMQNRELVGFRRTLVHHRTGFMNSVHGILLQSGISPKHTSFSQPWIKQVRKMGDYRINSYLDMINFTTDKIRKADARIRAAVKDDPDAQLLKTVPGVGDYISLIVSSAIDGIDRFTNSAKLCAYAGIVPSVRASADKTVYGHITHHGNSTLRWALVQATLIHTRNCKYSDLTNFHKKIAKKRGFSIATVAAASKMLRMMYWMLKEERRFSLNYSQDVSCVIHTGRKSRLYNCGHS